MSGEGNPPKAEKKQMVSLRIDKDVLDALRASGAGYQTRINNHLRFCAGLEGGQEWKLGEEINV